MDTNVNTQQPMNQATPQTSSDWVAIQMQTGGNQDPNSLQSLGVESQNTTLNTPDFYKNTTKVQEMFKDKSGAFDNNKFNAFYGSMVQSFNNYKQNSSLMGNATTDLASDDSMTRSLGIPIRKNPVQISLTSKDPFTNLKTAQGSFYGLTEINKWSDPKKSINEVAEGQKVVDPSTGKSLDYTPEDTGLFNLYGFLSEPLVLASYDKDERDAKGKILHKQGETKFNDQGLPFYETLSGRDPSGKQVLSRMDTLTKEGSYWNKFDFFDSDDLHKSVTGSIVKAAVQYAPMLIPGVNDAYAAYTIATGLVESGTSIAKAIDGMINGDSAKQDGLYKWANTLQGYTGQLKGGMSQFGKDNWWSPENLLNQAVDAVYILKSQSSLVKWPQEFAKWQMAKNLGVETESIINVGDKATNAVLGMDGIATYVAKYGGDEEGIAKSIQALQKNTALFNKYSTYAQHFSTAYMAATTAASISNLADQQGIDERDKGFLYLGYTAALIPFFNSQFGHWVNGRLGGLDDMAKGIDSALQSKGSLIFQDITQKTAESLGQSTLKEKAMFNLARGKQLGDKIVSYLKGLNVNELIGAVIANTVDMTSQKAISDGLQTVYNGLSSAGLTSSQENRQFNITPQSIAKDLISEGFSGAIGGAMFHMAGKLTGEHPAPTFSSDHLVDYVINGLAPEVHTRISDMKAKGQFGDTKLSINPMTDDHGVPIEGVYKPVNSENQVSQNDFIANRLTAGVKELESLYSAYNMQDLGKTAATKTDFFNGIVDTKTDTDLYLQLNDTMKKMFQVGAEINSFDKLEKQDDESLLTKKAELSILKKKLEYLQSNDSVDEFFTQGLFNIRMDINSAFGVKNRETIAQETTGRPYKQLNEAQQAKVDSLYQEYINDPVKGLMPSLQEAYQAYKGFDEKMESKGYYREINTFKESIEHLKKYITKIPLPYIPEGEDHVVALGETYKFTQDYMSKLAGVKYVPDYIFDQVKHGIGEIASHESEQVLNALSTNPEAFKSNVNSSLKSDLSNELIKEYVKKLIGDKQFTEFTDTPEFKDITINTTPESHYSTLKVLKDISFHAENIDPHKLNEQRQLVEQLGQFDPDMVQSKLEQYESGEIDKNDPVLSEFGRIDGLFDYIDHFKNEGHGSDMWGRNFSQEGLRRIIDVNHLEKTIGRDLSPIEKDTLYDSFDSNNIYTRLLTEGKYDLGNEDLNIHTLNNLDDASLRQSMDLLRNFDKERVPSPLRDTALDRPYAVLKSELENLNTVGVANYVNADTSFSEMLDSQLKAIERVAALVNAAATTNPLVNDFRANHKGLLSDELKDKILTILDNDDYNTLNHEMGRVYNQVKYLKDINDYNRNNTLSMMLKQDGQELVSKVQSLSDLIEDPDILTLVPSLNSLKGNTTINAYISTYRIASDDTKLQALPELAKIEQNIYKDVQNLTEDQKIALINKSFKPISSSSPDFYENIDATKPLNDSHRTIYFATIFGSSTTDFYANYAGKYDKDQEAFTNLNNSPYIPFAKQESAIRIANLIINGDQSIIKKLLNAYSYEGSNSTDIDYNKSAYSSFNSSNLVAILGSPGTGKTTASLYGIMNMVPDESANTIILAPKDRQLSSLQASLVKGGFEHRIDERSTTIREFLKNLNLQNKDGSVYDIIKHNEAINYYDSTTDDAGLRSKFEDRVDGAPSLKDLNTGLFDKLDIYAKNSKLKPEIANSFSKTKLFILDEFTHVNPIDIALLNKLILAYNDTGIVKKDPSKRASIIVLGDANQMGFLDNNGFRRDYTDVVNTIISQPLLTSLRSGWDLINNTLVDVGRRTIEVKNIASTNANGLKSSEVIQNYRDNHLQLFNYQGPDGTIGIKSVKANGGLKASDLDFIAINKDKQFNNEPIRGKDIVYVVDSEQDIPKAQSLLRETFGVSWPERVNIEIYKPEEVQGGEYKYAIIDAKPRFGTNSKYDIVRTHEFLNTMLSRASEATLIVENPSITSFVRFDNVSKERAINQKKITNQVIQQAKANKQRVMAAILGSDYVPQDAKPGSKIDTSGVPTSKSVQELHVLPTNDFIFSDKSAQVSQFTSKQSNIAAYTTYSTKADFDLIRSLPKAEDNITDSKIENIIQSLKYYIIKSPEIGENNVSLTANFRQYLSDYDYDSPKFYIEVAKREGDNIQHGRSEEFPQDTPDKELISLRVKLPSTKGKEPLDLTLGLLNSIPNLIKRSQTNKPIDDDDKLVSSFINELSKYMSGKTTSLDIGTSDNGKWRSREFSRKEWSNISTVWSARYKYDNEGSFSLNKLKQIYPDFHISDPHIVVSLLKDSSGNLISDNKDNKSSDLRGRSVVFMSEYKELQNLNAGQLLDVYMKQLEYFNTPEFKAASKEGKQAIIDGITDRISVGNFTLPYKPNMVEMIRLNTPKDSFLGFRENYIIVLANHQKGASIQELFEKFDMSPYVKDRLVKSLLTIKHYLDTSQDNRDWFQNEVINKVDTRGHARVEDIRQQALDRYGETGDFDQTDERNFNEVILSSLSPILKTEDFHTQLNDLLSLDDPNTIFRRKYATDISKQNSASVPDKLIDNPVEPSDLQLTLSPNKQVDFSKSVLDLNLLNLFKKTKNLNFAELIDESLKQFASLPQGGQRFDNYRLNSVLKNGEIENLVIANRVGLKRTDASSMLAEVKYTPNEFKFGFHGIQQTAYNIDFAKLLQAHSQETKPITEDVIYNLSNRVLDRLATLESKLPKDWMQQKFGDVSSVDSKYPDINDKFNFWQSVDSKLDSLNEIIRETDWNTPLKLDRIVAWQVSKNGIVAEHTVESDIKKGLIDEYHEFKGIQHDTIKLEPIDSINTIATFKAYSEDNELKVTYNAEDRSVEVTRIPKASQEETEEHFIEQSETGDKPQEVLINIGKELASIEPSKLTDINSFKEEAGRKLDKMLSYDQKEILLPNSDDIYNETIDKQHYYHKLIDSFMDRFVKGDKNDWYNDMINVAHAKIAYNESLALGLEAEEPDITDVTKKIKMKEAPKVDKLDILKKDVRDANAKATREFEYKVRDLFQGVAIEGSLKDWIKDFQLLHRSAIVNKVRSESEQQATLEELGSTDLAKTNPQEIERLFRDKIAQEPDLWKQYKKQFQELLNYRKEKSLTDC